MLTLRSPLLEERFDVIQQRASPSSLGGQAIHSCRASQVLDWTQLDGHQMLRTHRVARPGSALPHLQGLMGGRPSELGPNTPSAGVSLSHVPLFQPSPNLNYECAVHLKVFLMYLLHEI